MKQKVIIAIVSTTLAIVIAAQGSPVQAGSLRTKFGEVKVRGLKIGQTYSLDKLLHLPYRVINAGDGGINLKIETVMVTTDSVRHGYEPLPNLDWVKVEKGEFDELAPDHEAVTDITISLPNDPKLLGRKFEAHIWAHTWAKTGMIALGLESRLLIEIASTPPSDEELKKKFVDTELANLDFTLFPTIGLATSVPLGLDVNLLKSRKIGVKIVNPNDREIHFQLRSMANWEAMLSTPKGYEDAPEPGWIKPASEIIAVPANSILETALIARIPDEKRYHGKNYFFPISAQILEAEIPARYFYRLLLQTEKQGK
jgi:hypothetical protein